jgi:hypothetical protein
LLRFEELLEADAALLARIAAFLGLAGPARPWASPQAALRQHDPDAFGRGDPRWTPSDFWTDARLRVFYTLHGALLGQLGYARAEEVQAGAYPVGSDEECLVRFTRETVARRWEIQRECDARLGVIESLQGDRERRRDRTALTLLRRLVRR